MSERSYIKKGDRVLVSGWKAEAIFGLIAAFDVGLGILIGYALWGGA